MARTKVWSGSRKENEKLHSKQFTVNVTQADIDKGIARHDNCCVVACAIERQAPELQHISVDAATIRFTRVQKDGTRLRHILITPPTLQKIIIATDQGMKDKIKPTKAACITGMVIPSNPRGRPKGSANKKKRRAVAALKKNPVVRHTKGKHVPIVIGGKEPQKLSQRRGFGLRQMSL